MPGELVRETRRKEPIRYLKVQYTTPDRLQVRKYVSRFFFGVLKATWITGWKEVSAKRVKNSGWLEIVKIASVRWK